MSLVESADKLRFLERSSLSKGHHWEVRRGFAAIGYVKKNPSNGRLLYYIGLHNVQAISYEADTLEQIKSKIEQYG